MLCHLSIHFVQEEELVEWIFLCLRLFEHEYKGDKMLSISIFVNDLKENSSTFISLEEDLGLERVASASNHIRGGY